MNYYCLSNYQLIKNVKTDDEETFTAETGNDQSEDREDVELKQLEPKPMSEWDVDVEIPASAPKKMTLKKRVSSMKKGLLGKRD